MSMTAPRGRPPGFEGTSNRAIQYRCSRCGAEPGRENLTGVRVQFITLGKQPRIKKSRVTEWLCDTCLDADATWSTVPRNTAPGYKDTRHGQEN